MSYTPPPGGWPPPGDGQPGAGPPPGYGPPPPGYGQQPGYGPPSGYQGYVRAEAHPQGTTVLVLGILSLVFCGLLGPVAWSMGNNALKQIDAHPNAYSNRGSVSAGRICGIISSVLLIVGILFIVFAVVVAGSSGSSSTVG